MEERSNEELVERIEALTAELEEDVQEGGAGRREREKVEIQQAIEEHQKRLRDLCKKDEETENKRQEFLSIEEELGKRRREEEEVLEREKEEQAELRRRRRIRQEELEREREKEQERKRRISGQMEEAGNLQQQQQLHHQEQQQQEEQVTRERETGFHNLVQNSLL